jgi:tetratricopeptide (TPR) repeat protein
MPEDPPQAQGQETENNSSPGDQYNLSGDFRGAIINIKSTIVGSDEVKDIEDLPPEPGVSPFLGLQYFDEQDADHFFGREQLTARIVNRLSQTRFLAIIGASGSGKSSLVRAGVIPVLRRGDRMADGSLPLTAAQRWQIRILTPTAHPLDSLAVVLLEKEASMAAVSGLRSELAQNPGMLLTAARRTLAQSGQTHLLLVIDQFEEIYSLCRHTEEREAFIANLLTAVDPLDQQPVTILLTMRADFYAQLAQNDRLREAISQNQEFIGAMSREELFRAIIQPAALGKWKVQEGLVEVMLDDVGGEPGALPLLSHALLETWKRRRGRTLTVSGYTEGGGVHGAIAQTAEAVFRSRLTPEQRPIARMIFIRLAEIGEDSPDTRRRASFSELISAAVDERTIQLVVNILTDSRLITTNTIQPDNEKVVEVAHEALIREWPTLREWLNENRKDLIQHRQLTADTNDWIKLQRDPGALYRGERLRLVEEWLVQYTGAFSLHEQEFLTASREVADQEAKRLIQLARARRVQRALAGVSGGAVLSLILFILFSTGIIYGLRPPARMEGIYNVAVAEIGVIDEQGMYIPAQAGVGQRLSEWVSEDLQNNLADNQNIWVWHDTPVLRRQNVSIGRVHPVSEQKGAEPVELMAERTGADLIVYGNIDTRTTPAQLNLEFWLTPKTFVGFEEIQGSYRITRPITILEPSKPGLEVQGELRRQSSTLAWIAMGLTHSQLGQTEEALANFQQAETQSPDSEIVQFFLGREYLFMAGRSMDRRDELEQLAEQAFQKSIASNPEYARSHIGLGSVYHTQGQRLISALAKNAQTQIDLPALLDATVVIDRAIAAYQRAVDLQPDVRDYGVPVENIARQGLGISYRLKGEAHYMQGDTDQAAILFDQAIASLEANIIPFETAGQDRYLIQTYDGLGNAYFWRALLFESLQRYPESLEMYQHALDAYSTCITKGENSPDEFIQSDIVASHCIPFRQDVQEVIDSLKGDQG